MQVFIDEHILYLKGISKKKISALVGGFSRPDLTITTPNIVVIKLKRFLFFRWMVYITTHQHKLKVLLTPEEASVFKEAIKKSMIDFSKSSRLSPI